MNGKYHAPWRLVAISAPAQVGNALGLFDHAGLLCSEPPQNEASREGGPGDVITIQRKPDSMEPLEIEYRKRACDEEGYWLDVEPFSDLADSINDEPSHDLARLLIEKTLKAISAAMESEINSNGMYVTVTKYTPNGKVGLGLGGSASSASIVMALDYMFREPLLSLEEQDGILRRLSLMGDAEEVVSGHKFYDNVAPLAIPGGLIHIDDPDPENPKVTALPWPKDLWMTTITPEFALKTRQMREALNDKQVPWKQAEIASQYRAEVMRGLYTDDAARVIRYSGDSIVEGFRWPHIKASDALLKHIEQKRAADALYAIGISGSGPTVYVLSTSKREADQIGHELHEIWKHQGIMSWWFVHEHNKAGARVIEVS